jgi:alkyldihydroxyacetonephosphate synthase
LRYLAEVRTYGSVLFPDFEAGSKFMRDLAKNRVFPASCRVVDNLQFQFAYAFSPAKTGAKEILLNKIKKYYVTKIIGFDPKRMCVATLLFEGMKDEVELQQKKLYNIAKIYNGIKGGPEAGIRGYFLTFVIAYIRDLCMQKEFIAESFETSCPWYFIKNS